MNPAVALRRGQKPLHEPRVRQCAAVADKQHLGSVTPESPGSSENAG